MRVSIIVVCGIAIIVSGFADYPSQIHSSEGEAKCEGPKIVFERTRSGDEFHYQVASIQGGPYPLDGLWYSFDGEANLSSATYLQGGPWNIARLAGEGSRGNVSFVGSENTSKINTGDQIVVSGDSPRILHVYDRDGNIVGGNWECQGAVPAGLYPPPGCGASDLIELETHEVRGNITFTATSVAGGPHQLSNLTYEFRSPRDNGSVPPGGTFLNASRNGGSGVRYQDNQAPTDTVDPTDQLIVDDDTWLGLVIRDNHGRRIGGTGACA